MVYVQDIDGKPMMPTTRHGKVRQLLKDKKAVVINTCPFTIKLMYKTSDYKQEIVLGVDAGLDPQQDLGDDAFFLCQCA